MIYAQEEKNVMLITPVAGSAGATFAATFDRLGYDYVVVEALLGTSGTAATANPSVFKIGQADVSNISSHADISGTIGDTDWTIPTGVSAGTQIYKVCLDLRGRKRYLSLSSTLGAATNIAAQARLSRAGEAPTSASDQGVDALVIV